MLACCKASLPTESELAEAAPTVPPQGAEPVHKGGEQAEAGDLGRTPTDDEGWRRLRPVAAVQHLASGGYTWDAASLEVVMEYVGEAMCENQTNYEFMDIFAEQSSIMMVHVLERSPWLRDAMSRNSLISEVWCPFRKTFDDVLASDLDPRQISTLRSVDILLGQLGVLAIVENVENVKEFGERVARAIEGWSAGSLKTAMSQDLPGPSNEERRRTAYVRFLAEAAKKKTVPLLREAIAEGEALGLGPEELNGAASALQARQEHLASLGEMYTSKESIQDALKGGDTVLLKGSWLVALSRSGGTLPRRQDLPPEAVWDPEELMPRVPEFSDWTKFEIGSRVPHDPVGPVGISYCWETPEHPDPRGEQLRLLAGLVERRMGPGQGLSNPVVDLAIFLDWPSLPQRERSEEDQARFDRGLGAVNLWYGHSLVEKWLLTALPAGAPAAMKPYGERGWPCFERALAELITKWDYVIDVGRLEGQQEQLLASWLDVQSQCRVPERAPPPSPEAFGELLRTKTFTNAADHAFVERKYAQTAEELFYTARKLDFAGRGWDDAAVQGLLEGPLAGCGRLRVLRLGSNDAVGDAGAAALARHLPSLAGGRLEELDLGFTGIGDAGAESLAAALPACPRLEALDLLGCTEITAAGRARLRAAWRAAGKEPDSLLV